MLHRNKLNRGSCLKEFAIKGKGNRLGEYEESMAKYEPLLSAMVLSVLMSSWVWEAFT